MEPVVKTSIAQFIPRRHRKRLRDNIYGVTKPAIRRLARRGGVTRMSLNVYPTIRKALIDYLHDIIGDVVNVMESSMTPTNVRKTVTTRDVVYALRRRGKTIYGFDG